MVDRGWMLGLLSVFASFLLANSEESQVTDTVIVKARIEVI
jgi:hypothetical protein